MIKKGSPASSGIAIAKVFKFENTTFDIKDTKIDNFEKEISRFKLAISQCVDDINKIKTKVSSNLSEEELMIFDAHIQIAQDPEITGQVIHMIETENVNSAYALYSVTEMFASIFEGMESEIMQERAADVRDVAKRIISHLLGVRLNDPSTIKEEVIIFAHDLTPSDTAQLNKGFVKGFVTSIGGKTSHSAIMARSMGIPAIVGATDIDNYINNDDIIIIDGRLGNIIINPSQDEINIYKEKQKTIEESEKIWKQYLNKPSITKDGKTVEIAANIGSPDDLESVLSSGSEGIGLYRTEFLYMGKKDFPSEEEQVKDYKKVLQAMGDKKVIIRTLDIGGDKQLDYLPLDQELNPFLGHRALRLCLTEEKLFRTQLRALLRSSIYGNLHIMFPMVATIDELRQAKTLLNRYQKELIEEGFEVSDKYKIGIMVEIPAVAILSDIFAKEVDFFSIGTNDLMQYTFAADRMNEKVSYLYQPLNPSILRLISLVIDNAHKNNVWVGMCGEMASNQLAAPILLGLGLDEFSMSASSVLQTRYLFDRLNYKDLKILATNLLTLATSSQVESVIKESLEDMIKTN